MTNEGKRRRPELYDKIIAVVETAGDGAGAWNVTTKLRESGTHANDVTVRLYLEDLVKEKRLKKIQIGNRFFYRVA